MLSTRLSHLTTETSRFVLIAAMAVALPMAVHAAQVDDTTPLAGGNGNNNLNSGDFGRFTGTADSTSILTYAGGGSIGAAGVVITTDTNNNAGNLNIAGGSTLAGTIGSAGHTLNVLNLLGTGQTSSLSGTSYINTVNNLGTNTFNLNGSGATYNIGTLAMGTGSTTNLSSGNTLTSSSVTGAGTLNFAGADTFNYSGSVGSSGTRLNTIGLTGNNTFTASSGAQTIYTTNGVNFANNGTLSVGGTGTTFNGDGGITATTNGQGTLNITGNTSVIGATAGGGRIGTSTNRLNTVAFGTTSGNALTADGNVYLNNGLALGNNGLTLGSSAATTIDVGSGQVISTATDNQGTINVGGAGNTTFVRGIGVDNTHRINALNVATGTTTLQGTNNYITGTALSSSGTLALANNAGLTGAVTTTTDNTGTLTLGTGSTLTGTAGTSASSRLNQVTLASGANVTNNVFSTNTNLTTATVGGNVTGGAASALTFAGVNSAVNGNVSDTTVNYNGTGSQNIGGTLAATNVNFGANGTAAITGNTTITGNVANTSGTNNQGNLTVSGNSNIAGAIAARGARINNFIYTGGTNNTLTLGSQGYVYGFGVTGAAGSTVLFSQNAGLSSVNSVTGGNNTFTFTANNNASSVGGLTSANAVDLSSSNVVLNTAAVTSDVANRTRYTLAQNSTNTAIVAAASVTESGPAISGVSFRNVFNSSAGNGVNNQLQVMALQNGYYTAAANNVNGNGDFAAYLANNVEAGNTDVNGNTVNTYLNTLSNQIAAGDTSGAKNTLRQGQAQAQSNNISNVTTQGFVNVVNNRDGNVRLAQNGLGGMNTGDGVKPGQSLWAQAFGGTGNQDERHSEVGFDAHSAGAAVGYDREVAKHTVLGVAAAYSNGRIETNDVQQHTDVDTYQASIYGHTYVTPDYFVEGQAGGSYNKYDGSRQIFAGNTAANSDYDGWGYFANLKAGRDFALRNQYLLTPFAALTYIGNSFEGYTENGAGGLNLHVDSDQTNLLTGRLGTELGKAFSTADGSKIRPSVHAAYLHDLIQDNQTATTNFIGTGTAGSFNTDGVNQSRDGFNAGVGVNLLTVGRLDLSATYDYEWRDRFDGHSGLVRARYNF